MAATASATKNAGSTVRDASRPLDDALRTMLPILAQLYGANRVRTGEETRIFNSVKMRRWACADADQMRGAIASLKSL
jgi:hypothetical protein